MKKAFTLIELIISIILIALITTYLLQTIGLLNTSNKQLATLSQKRNYLRQIKKNFILDIMQAKKIKITQTKNKNFDFLELETTKNSLHNLVAPKVVYFITKEHSLIRVEGFHYKLPLNSENLYKVAFDEVAKDIILFKIYQNKQKNKIFIFIKSKYFQDIFFEVLTF